MINGVLLLLGAALFVLLALAERCGRWIRLRSVAASEMAVAGDKRISHSLASIFGLLTLLLGFSFNIALGQFNTRRNYVAQEANAISTAHSRARLADPQARDELQRLLADYAHLRLDYGHANDYERPALVARSARMRHLITEAGWQAAAPLARMAAGPAVLASVEAVSDVGVARESAMDARIPYIVFIALVGFATAAAAMVGFTYPVFGKGPPGHSYVLFALLSATVIMILDIDRPARGSVTVSQAPLERLIADLS